MSKKMDAMNALAGFTSSDMRKPIPSLEQKPVEPKRVSLPAPSVKDMSQLADELTVNDFAGVHPPISVPETPEEQPIIVVQPEILPVEIKVDVAIAPKVAPPVKAAVIPAPAKDLNPVAEAVNAQVYDVKISRITRFEGQPRRFFDQAALERLADSIQSEGQEQPIKICNHPLPYGDVKFMLVDGERRLRAHNLIWERTGKEPTIKAIIEVIKNPKEHFRKSVIANLHREDLSALDEAAALFQLKEDGLTQQELCDLIGKSLSYVDGYLRMHTLPDAVKELMSEDLPKDSRLNTTAAITIARSTRDERVRLELARESVNRQLGINDIRFMIHSRIGNVTDEITDDDSYDGKLIKRKPSATYANFKKMLGRTESQLNNFDKTQNIDIMYNFRDDETGDRQVDAACLRNIIIACQNLLAKVEQT